MSENTYYARKIRYLDLLDQGERIGGAGFLKTEVRGKDVSLFITVKGLHPTDTYERDVTLQMAEGELNIGQISLKGGQGQFAYRADMALSELRGIKIVLGGTREIFCKWQEEKRTADEMIRDQASSGNSVLSSGIQEDVMSDSAMSGITASAVAASNTVAPDIAASARSASALGLSDITAPMVTAPDEEPDVIDVPDIAAPSMTPSEDPKQYRMGVANIMRRNTTVRSKTYENKAAAAASVINASERNALERNMPQRQNSEGNAGRRRKAVRLMEDKWQQISAIYPHVHPFRDEREYLSISPADFVMLTSKAYRAANNSFLLHGYYNYDHLILAKIEKRGEVVYYIGVPGSYYEREKQVAVMFGFESFECGTEPAQAGDFGYYMMRTEL